ncbi:MAG: DUF2007 domain-containing protein [Acidimicrobiia bacterium]|nr:DUF2007 domain-containing protein [Acidimicrobiia bacterium]
MTESRPAFVRLAVVADLMTARMAVARLESEGIEARVLGDGLSPYRLTVGDLATTEVWVAEDRLAEAAEIMLVSEIDGLPDPDRETEASSHTGLIVLAALALLTVIAYRVLGAVL